VAKQLVFIVPRLLALSHGQSLLGFETRQAEVLELELRWVRFAQTRLAYWVV
jgi:hypothetical protein